MNNPTIIAANAANRTKTDAPKTGRPLMMAFGSRPEPRMQLGGRRHEREPRNQQDDHERTLPGGRKPSRFRSARDALAHASPDRNGYKRPGRDRVFTSVRRDSAVYVFGESIPGSRRIASLLANGPYAFVNPAVRIWARSGIAPPLASPCTTIGISTS